MASDVVSEQVEAEAGRLASELAAGRGGTLWVIGDAGAGKSSALRAIARHATAHGIALLELSGAPHERELPFACVVELLPALPESRDERATMQAGLDVRAALAERASRAPLLLLVDDADMIDACSLDTLAFALRRLRAAPIAAVLSGSAALPGQFARTRWLTLPSLSDEQAEALVETLAPEAAAEVRRQLVVLSDGRPGVLMDLIASLGVEQLRGSRSLARIAPAPGLCARVVAPLARDLRVRWAALLLAAEPGVAKGVARRAARRLGLDDAVLDQLERDRLIDALGERLWLRPRAAGLALYSLAASGELHDLHRALADAQPPAAEERRAWHRAAAALEPDDALADPLEAAQQSVSASGGAPAVADALERSAELSTDAEVRGRRYSEAAEAAWLGGQPERARALLFRAQEQSTSAALAIQIAYVRGSIELAAGSVDYALTVLRDAAAQTVAAGVVPSAALPMLVRGMDAAMSAGDLAQAVALGRLAEPASEDDDDLAVARARLVAGVARLLADDREAGLELLDPLVVGIPTDADQGHLLIAVRAALVTGHIRRAAAFAAAAADRVRESESIGLLPFVTARQSLADLLLGRLDNAKAVADEGLRQARLLGQHNAEAEHLGVAALAAARHGSWDDCVVHSEQALRLATAHGLAWPAALATWALAELELSHGRPDQALERLEALWSGAPRERHPIVAVWATPDLVEAAVRAGVPAAGDAPLASLINWAELTQHAWAGAIVERCRGLRASDADEAKEAFEAALELHQEADRPFDLARTQLAYGESLRRMRRRAECRSHLRAALERFENCGAARWEERARDEVRASGDT
ncbi:MAG TPA: AAA family ATPase [Conexibacter sp.]|nr:AAA family ATPase [Conexibacter sp.]